VGGPRLPFEQNQPEQAIVDDASVTTRVPINKRKPRDSRSSEGGFVYLAGVILVVVLGRCLTSRSHIWQEGDTGIDPGEAITILIYRDFKAYEPLNVMSENEVANCLSAPMKDVLPDLRIIPPDEFRQIAFPHLESEVAPVHPEYLTLLLDHPGFRDRMAKIGLRFIIVIGMRTENVDPEGLIACGASYGGAGCLGVVVWDRASGLAASILDLKQAQQNVEMQASTTGKSGFAIVGFLPLLFPSRTEAPACADLGEGIARFLTGNHAPAP
jgi:hypothetical protein